MQRQYPAEVFWSDEDKGFIAVAPDLPGCSAWGETRLEALDSLDGAIVAWIDAAGKAGNPIPPPSPRHLEARHSGKVLLRLPKSLHSKLATEADEDGVSLNQYVLYVLSERHGDRAYQKAFHAAVGLISKQILVSGQQTHTFHASGHDTRMFVPAFKRVYKDVSASSASHFISAPMYRELD